MFASYLISPQTWSQN